MKLNIFYFTFLIGLAVTQEAAVQTAVQPVPTLTCANVLCMGPGGCAMVEPFPGGKPQPQCLDVSCKSTCQTTKCAANHQCVMTQVTCVKAPCCPVPQCRPIKVDPVPTLTCANVLCMGPGRCAMVEPFPGGKPQPQCLDPSCKSTCQTTKCAADHECVMTQVTCVKAPCCPQPQCRPIKVNPVPTLTCANVLCMGPGGCAMVEPFPGGKPQPQCLDPSCKSTCQTTKCAANQVCVMTKATCVKEPCCPVPQCRPIKVDPVPPLTCATMLCKAPGRCVMVESPGSKPQPQCLDASCRNTCSNKFCWFWEECFLSKVTCVKEPCCPIPTCRLRKITFPPLFPIREKRQAYQRCTGKNQVWSDCGSACPARCDQKEPVMCPAVCVAGCFCKDGYILNDKGQCVKHFPLQPVPNVREPISVSWLTNHVKRNHAVQSQLVVHVQLVIGQLKPNEKSGVPLKDATGIYVFDEGPYM
ncbi:hypothetical protein L3Y34_009999 [Caenorhabditis briggsae]|uniref:Follistatin-like domain-containing protein n=1 Tax=Caenorhabditis briggsae TaxID=6238 RepID=A0AAE9D2L5_CAEBR|nr:hypothetical protein L3Y34_009999 [Caenorhabditis briggsae]